MASDFFRYTSVNSCAIAMVVLVAPALSTISAVASTASAAASSAVLKSFASDGVNFFNSLRTPAALVAAAAIKDAFALQSAPDDVKKSRAWTALRNMYLLLQLACFSSTILCIFISTHAIVNLQCSAGVSGVTEATSLIAMMRSHFEFEYVSVRASFGTGLLAFVVAQALRVRYELRRAKEMSWAAMWLTLASAAFMVAYNNSKSITYGGYTGLVARWGRLSVQLLLERSSFAHPMPLVCAFLTAFGSAIAVRVALRLALDQLDEDKDGSVSWKEATGFVTNLPGRAWRLMTSKDQINQQPQA